MKKVDSRQAVKIYRYTDGTESHLHIAIRKGALTLHEDGINHGGRKINVLST
jgi:hypothetical protein